ncbi:uncharacterized protein LOC144180612 [Haemaphysalis longicornis]
MSGRGRNSNAGLPRAQDLPRRTYLSLPIPLGRTRLLDFTVKSASGLSTPAEALSSDTGLDVKKIMHGKLGLPPNLQLLFYAGKELEDSYVLEYRGVRQGSEIRILTCLREGYLTALERDVEEEEAIEIAVVMRPGKHVFVKTSLRQSIGCIKRSIEEAAGVPVAQQTLRLNDEDLGDDQTVSFYRLHNGGVVYFYINE